MWVQKVSHFSQWGGQRSASFQFAVRQSKPAACATLRSRRFKPGGPERRHIFLNCASRIDRLLKELRADERVARRLLRGLLRAEVFEQAGEGGLEGVVLLPVREVGDEVFAQFDSCGGGPLQSDASTFGRNDEPWL